MLKIRLVIFFVALHVGNVYADDPFCQTHKDNIANILGMGDIFFGEIHGSVESPQFLKCVVEAAILAKSEQIFVAVEMTADARDLNSEFWKDSGRSEDGRSSEAMYRTMQAFIDAEDRGELKLLFLQSMNVGEELKRLSIDGQVFAYAGNMHSMKFRTEREGPNFVSEGMQVGMNFTHIYVGNAYDGEVWACMGICGKQRVVGAAAPLQVEPHTLGDGAFFGHDYVYLLGTFTPSPPHDLQLSE